MHRKSVLFDSLRQCSPPIVENALSAGLRLPQWDLIVHMARNSTIECRTAGGAVLAPHVEITATNTKSDKKVNADWRDGTTIKTILPWTEDEGVPVFVAVQTNGGGARTPVRDLRGNADGHFLCGVFDDPQLGDVLGRLAEERYGYLSDAVSGDRRNRNDREEPVVPGGANYAVPAYVDARRRFHLVDNWWKELCDADVRVRPFILKDGRTILQRWATVAASGEERGIRLAAKVAADELDLRIRSFACP